MHKSYFTDADCDLEAFAALCAQELDRAEVPLAADVVKNIPIYDIPALAGHLSDADKRQALMAEWAYVLGQSAGVLVLRQTYGDTAVIDAVTEAFDAIIAEEGGTAGGGADHFAAAGSNARIWNALQKLCMRDPALFARYFGNDALAAIFEAWLGPGYQVTAQVNLVRPGGKAQTAHRDYHLGFQTEEIAKRFPAHVHDLSPVLTLQGAIAHCDVSVDSGPTKLLPFSQLFRPGYLAYRKPAFAAFFEEHCVQVPLQKGDTLFFSPALFHAAGDNRTQDVQRMVNLLQVSSPLGIAMEAIDRAGMCRALYPKVQELAQAGALAQVDLAAAVAAAADGYSFPTSMDTDPPVGGLAPETMGALFLRALDESLTPDAFNAALDALQARRRP